MTNPSTSSSPSESTSLDAERPVESDASAAPPEAVEPTLAVVPEAVEPEPEPVAAEPEPERELEPEPVPEVPEPEPVAEVAFEPGVAPVRPSIGDSPASAASRQNPQGLPVPKAPPGSLPPGPGGVPRPAVQVGRIVSVDVTAVSPDEIEVKLADGRPGVIAKPDFADEPPPGVGSTIDAALLARDDPRHRVVLSRSWAVKQLQWERVEAAMASHEPLTGPVTKVIKGGLIVDLGLRAFLPASMIDEQPTADPAALVGTEVTVIVTEVERSSDRVVVSRRDHLRRQRRKTERDVFSSLVVGKLVSGTVVGLVEYGAHVDIGGARALVHRSEMAWGRVNKPAEVLAVGDTVEAVVIEVNKSKRRIGLSIRQLEPDPFAAIEVAMVTTAEVTRVVEYGVFARLDGTDIVGLIHMTELTDLPGFRPDQVVTPGENIHVKVLSIDPKKRRVSLSVRQALWS